MTSPILGYSMKTTVAQVIHIFNNIHKLSVTKEGLLTLSMPNFENSICSKHQQKVNVGHHYISKNCHTHMWQ
jgi:hypothetical protein